MKLFSEISNILRLISRVGVYLGDLRVGRHGLCAAVALYFVLALRFSALSATEVFPGEWKRTEQGAERVSATAESSGR